MINKVAGTTRQARALAALENLELTE